MKEARRFGLASAIGTGWLASLWLPVATEASGPGLGATTYGGGILAIGWLGIFVHQLSWFANPLLPLSLYALVRDRGESTVSFVVLGGLMAGCGINALCWDRVADDAGVHRLVAYHAGYWCWLAAVLASASWLLRAGWLNHRAKAGSL